MNSTKPVKAENGANETTKTMSKQKWETKHNLPNLKSETKCQTKPAPMQEPRWRNQCEE